MRLAAAVPRGGWIGLLGAPEPAAARAAARRGARPVALGGGRALRGAAAGAAVAGRVESLPLARHALAAADAPRAYARLAAAALPEALARLQLALAVDAPLRIALPVRLGPARARALLEGAGFRDVRVRREAGPPARLRATARRAFTLPDYLRPRLALLVAGLNPSLYAAETGIPFGRPGNRFWPAAARAGLLPRPRDPFEALRRGVGFTDLVKRTTRGAAELRTPEYAAGVARLEAVVRRERPRALCLVGLDGWRRAADPDARPGWLPGALGGAPLYLMPSTSGLNAHASLEELAAHLSRAAAGAAPAAAAGRRARRR